MTRRLLDSWKARVRLSRVQGDGSTLRDHLESAAKTSEHAREQLAEEEPPECVAYLLDWYSELKTSSIQSGMAPSVITFEAIEAWQRLRGRVLTQWELTTILRLDSFANQEASIQSKEERTEAKKPGAKSRRRK